MTGSLPASLLELVSARVGIVRDLERVSKGRSEPELPIIFRSVLANFDYRRTDPTDRVGAGKGETLTQARLSAIGEALERYCSSQVDPSRLIFAAPSELPAPALAPASLVLYAEHQYASLPYRRPTQDMPITWIRGCLAANGEPVYLPASMVYLGYGGANLSEHFAMPTSNGLAAGPDLDFAVRAGIFELLERDAFLATWMNRLPAPEIHLQDLGGAAGQAVRHYARHGVRVRVFHLLNGLPVHACMAIGLDQERRAPAAVVGLSCDLDPVRAVAGSIMEMAQVRPGIVHRCREQTPTIERYENVRSIEDHSAFFAMPAHVQELDFLLGEGSRQHANAIEDHSTGGVGTDIAKCATLLRAAGIDIAYVDITTEDLTEFPVRVVRVVATTLQPMHFGFGNERLGGNRIFTIAKELGFSTETRTAAELNPCPHPLA